MLSILRCARPASAALSVQTCRVTPARFYLETFIDPQRFRGTCYRAANWKVLGVTTGRGKDDRAHKANRPIKEVLGYPLVKDFRQRLSRLDSPVELAIAV